MALFPDADRRLSTSTEQLRSAIGFTPLSTGASARRHGRRRPSRFAPPSEPVMALGEALQNDRAAAVRAVGDLALAVNRAIVRAASAASKAADHILQRRQAEAQSEAA